MPIKTRLTITRGTNYVQSKNITAHFGATAVLDANGLEKVKAARLTNKPVIKALEKEQSKAARLEEKNRKRLETEQSQAEEKAQRKAERAKQRAILAEQKQATAQAQKDAKAAQRDEKRAWKATQPKPAKQPTVYFRFALEIDGYFYKNSEYSGLNVTRNFVGLSDCRLFSTIGAAQDFAHYKDVLNPNIVRVIVQGNARSIDSTFTPKLYEGATAWNVE